MNTKIQQVLTAFKNKYPSLNPIKLYKIPNGYLIIAPRFKDKTDYGDPNFFVSDDLSSVGFFNMSKIQQMFDAFDRGPIWTDRV